MGKEIPGNRFGHHRAGNYLVPVNNMKGKAEAYAIAIHFKNDETQRKTTELVGSNELGFVFQRQKDWRYNFSNGILNSDRTDKHIRSLSNSSGYVKFLCSVRNFNLQ